MSWKEITAYRSQIPSIKHLPTVIDCKKFIAENLIRTNSSVLDVGSSDGTFLHEYLLPLGFKGVYIGVDPDPSLRKADLDFILYDSLENVKGTFSVVLLLDVIEHFELTKCLHYLKIIKERLLETKGFLLISTPNVFCPFIHSDVTHMTFYPYADLYGILKSIRFEKMNFYRTTPLFEQEKKLLKKLLIKLAVRPLYLLMGLDYYSDIFVIVKNP